MAVNTTLRPLDGYPQPFGSSKGSVWPHQGPASYTPVTEASPLATVGGDLVQAIEAGLKLFDFVFGGLSDDGLFRVECIPVNANSSGQPKPSLTYRLRWVVVSTGAEVATGINLSVIYVRLAALGPK